MEGPQVRFHENGGGSSGGSPCLTHSKKYRKRKTRSGRKVPDRPGRFNPIYQEGKDILDPLRRKREIKLLLEREKSLLKIKWYLFLYLSILMNI